MNINPELQIGRLPWRYAAGRIDIPGLRLVEGMPWELRLGDRVWALRHVRPEEGPREPAEFADYAKAAATTRGSLPLVLGPYLREDVRRALETARVSYLDYHGNAHIEAPGLLVHVRMPVTQETSRALGIVGVRGAQTMLGQAERAWGVTDLAREARVSAGQAQNVMKTLEAESLVYTEGKGPSRKRRISDRGRLLDWLNLQKPGRDPRGKLSCALYGRTPEDIWHTIGMRLEGTEHAITGAAAASILGVGPTSLPHTIVRVAARGSLQPIAERLKAEPTVRGANLVLWSDTGLLGVTGSSTIADKMIAPQVRVYLDLYAELRGADLASEFRERVLGY
jgi:hypothetical protein